MSNQALIHYACFLSLGIYFCYYLGVRTLNLKTRIPRIGVSLCYGYPNWLVSFLSLGHFVLLALTWAYLIGGPSLGHWSLLISILLLGAHLKALFFLRDFFCRIFLHKEGVVVAYLDGRVFYCGFHDIIKVKEEAHFYFFKSLFLEFEDRKPYRLYNFWLLEGQELKVYLQDRVSEARGLLGEEQFSNELDSKEP